MQGQIQDLGRAGFRQGSAGQKSPSWVQRQSLADTMGSKGLEAGDRIRLQITLR